MLYLYNIIFVILNQTYINNQIIIRFYMILFEIFNKPADWEYVYNHPGLTTATFIVNGIHYKFTAERVFHPSATKVNGKWDDGLPATWIIEFTADVKDGWGVINMGGAPEVFATVIAIMRHFIQQRDPKILSIGAVESNRMRLYKRMIRVILPDWRIHETSRHLDVIAPDAY
jgi:hypothetical protein